jgi:hypothetical protein
LHYFKGDFMESEREFAEIFKSAKPRFSSHHLAWGAYGKAENLLALGKVRQAHRLIGVATKLLQRQADFHSELICHGIDAMAQLRLGRLSEARASAIVAVDIARRVVPNNFSSLEGYAAPIEVLLCLRGADPTSSRRDARHLNEAFKSLTNYAWLFPIGRPRLWYLRGLRSYLEGDRHRTRQNWRRSLVWASDLDMKYEEYRACEALRRFGALADADLMPITKRAENLSTAHGYGPHALDPLH